MPEDPVPPSRRDSRLQLRHPRGKRGITMKADRYRLLRSLVMRCLRTGKSATLTEMATSAKTDLKVKEKRFEGSLLWHLEWVKLDLEARGTIMRVPKTSPQRYTRVR